MPKNTDLKKILLIGSGPIVIGQGCEFDYSGAQACKALLEEGYEVVLLNSNPATIMTDPEFATRTYVEPITAGDGRSRFSPASGPTAFCRRSAGRPRSTWRWSWCATARSSSTASNSSAQTPRPSRRAKIDCSSRKPCSRLASTCRFPAWRTTSMKPARSRRRPAASRSSSARPSRSAARVAASPTTRRNSRPSSRAGSIFRPSARSSSRNRSSAGRNSRWRSCATATTTAC